MDFSAQLDALKKQVDDTVASTKAAAQEDRDHLKERIKKAEKEADRALKDTQQTVGDAAGRSRSKWEKVKTDAATKMDEAKERMAKRGHEMDASAAATDAHLAEMDAAGAIDFASWAVENARVNILEALDATANAAELARAAAS